MDDLSLITRQRPVATRAEVLERLRAHEADIRRHFVTALYLFGSAARDELGTDSDVDVFVDYNPEAPFTILTLSRLQRELSEDLGRKADIATRDSLHPMLRDDIEAASTKVF